ncbi:hypothetical protein EDB81DRAFT_900465 [Dactylonectria macrodidyma]|uniref:NmrA-like domain-containing protein n=1 Tax=Dactylonectria macrodidyma TaxID=307937 RepID=A0A9P9ENM9_9HYPO|nr:hypothetical protein EDB81DRAFT_900465 [Dactylonectria macrodidyma]
MARALLITGSTGNQGGAVIDALIAKESSDFLILAATRDAESARAKQLAAKSPSIKLVEVSMGKGVTLAGEVQQGKALVAESIKAGVSHFVYSSVERGGDERSWDNPTPVPHFKTKHEIEHYLRDSAAKHSMGWTILRPVIFMENLQPGFAGKVFLTTLRDTVKEKPLQWVATKDIGYFAAEAFHNPTAWDKKAVGLAGDQLAWSQFNQVFKDVTGEPISTTFGLLGKALKHGVSEVGVMLDWFKNDGYKANMSELKKTNPNMTTMKAWLSYSSFIEKP